MKSVRRNAIAVYAAGLSISIISFVALLKTDPFGLSDLSQNPELPAFFFSVAILLLSDRISAMMQFAENRELSEDIAEMVKSAHSVTSFRTPRDAIQYVNNRMGSLLSVESVSLNMEDEFSTTDDYLYRSEVYQNYLNLIAKNVSDGLIWKDIGDTYAEKKFSITRDQIIPEKTKGSFQTRIVGGSDPQITFLILGYRDGTKEVLFNWDYRSPGSEPAVLLSQDSLIVKMFSTHFANLWRSSN